MTDTSLSALRHRFAGCEIVLLVDLSTKTALSWDSAIKWPQEEVETLSTLAAGLLAFAAAQAQPDVVYLSRDTGDFVVVAGPGDVAEGLICGFAPGSDLADVAQASRAVLEALLVAEERARA